jgi:hypothetical protein
MAQGNNANAQQHLVETMQELTAAVQKLVAAQQAAAEREVTATAREQLTDDQQMAANELVRTITGRPQAVRDHALRQVNRSRNEILVELINSHNPYTSNNVGDMSVFAGNPNPANITNSIDQIELEVDGPYSMAMEWNFKGSPQKINKTIRIKYRYLARNLDLPTRPEVEPRHWVTAYLLIGYEDGGA